MTGPDVPTEVHAALRAAHDLIPRGPAPRDPAGRADWWNRHAQADEAEQHAAERLHEWAITTSQPPAVTTVIGIAIELLAAEIRRCHAEARRAREEQR